MWEVDVKPGTSTGIFLQRTSAQRCDLYLEGDTAREIAEKLPESQSYGYPQAHPISGIPVR